MADARPNHGTTQSLSKHGPYPKWISYVTFSWKITHCHRSNQILNGCVHGIQHCDGNDFKTFLYQAPELKFLYKLLFSDHMKYVNTKPILQSLLFIFNDNNLDFKEILWNEYLLILSLINNILYVHRGYIC